MKTGSFLRSLVLGAVLVLGLAAAPSAFARHYGYSISFGGPGYGVTYSDCHHCGGGWWSGYVGGGWVSPGYARTYYAPAYYVPTYYAPAYYYGGPYYDGYYASGYYDRPSYRTYRTHYRDDDRYERYDHDRRAYRHDDGYRDRDRHYDRGREYGRRDHYYGH